MEPLNKGHIQDQTHLLGVEMVVVLSMHITIVDTDCGPDLAVPDDADAVVPQAGANLVVWKPPQDENFISDLDREGGEVEVFSLFL